jgi:hypothetical protein
VELDLVFSSRKEDLRLLTAEAETRRWPLRG